MVRSLANSVMCPSSSVRWASTPGVFRAGQPLAVLERDEPVVASVPQLHGHTDVAHLEPPVAEVRHAVVPPAVSSGFDTELHGAQPPADRTQSGRPSRVVIVIVSLVISGTVAGLWPSGPEKTPVQGLVTAASYRAHVHEQKFASSIDSEQVFVFQWSL